MDLIHGHFYKNNDKIKEKIKDLELFVGCDLSRFASEHNYNENIMSLLNGNPNDETQKILKDNWANADRRTPEEYGFELILNWILEDFLLEKILPKYFINAKINKSGADKNREFLLNKSVKTDPDITILTDNGNSISVEIVADFGGYWKKTRTIEMRINKYPKLLKKSEKQDVFLFCVDIKNKKTKLIKVSKENEAKHIPLHTPWKKPAYQISIDTSTFDDIDKIVA